MTAPRNDGSDDLDRVLPEVRARLAARGVALDGGETPEQMVQIQNAVERFERAVQVKGGDLMVDEGVHGEAATQPDDRHFALPLRRGDESVDGYIARLARATEDVRQHRPTA